MSGFDDLSFGEPESIPPKKMARKTAALPAPLAAAFLEGVRPMKKKLAAAGAE